LARAVLADRHRAVAAPPNQKRAARAVMASPKKRFFSSKASVVARKVESDLRRTCARNGDCRFRQAQIVLFLV
jgi:hypothetical protein